MIDPFMITTGIATAVAAGALIYSRAMAEIVKERDEAAITALRLFCTANERARSAEAVLERQRQQRLIASRLGTAASQKKAAAKLAARQTDTHAAIAQGTLRPRAEVVADVAAKRAAKNSGAGVVASKTG